MPVCTLGAMHTKTRLGFQAHSLKEGQTRIQIVPRNRTGYNM